MEQENKWNTRYRNSRIIPEPARVLQENQHLLPPHGRALDLACGLGANGRLLSEHGLETLAWDLSPVAIERCNTLSKAAGVSLRGEVHDVIKHPPSPKSFDVIVVSHFLERALAPVLCTALRPEGLLFYQTFTKARTDDTGPSNPCFRLDDNELLHLFASLKVLVYREEGRVGNVQLGLRNHAMLVAQKARLSRLSAFPEVAS